MPSSNSSPALNIGTIYKKDSLVNGQPTQIKCFDIGGQTYSISSGPVKIAGLEDDWFEDQKDPEKVISILAETKAIDIFTFWQRLPDLSPRYPQYHRENLEIAVLPVTTYDQWFNHQIKPRVRTLVRKAEKEGITVRQTVFDDEFVRGMTAIFNEAPVRQGRKFWHYGKDFQTVKRQFSRYIDREIMIAAYFEDEIIGLIMLGKAGCFGLTGQIISSLKHRDKSTNNALVAKAVEVCEQQGLNYLCYLFWSDDSLAEFKRRCGFQKLIAPRYFIPLTAKGRWALKCGAHRGWKNMIPSKIKVPLKQLRRAWNEFASE